MIFVLCTILCSIFRKCAAFSSVFQYLKNCTAVWVVAAIHRAIDDKTAKNLLGENFRRQLLMDGQYGSVAFICSKTDVLVPSEIMK